MFQATDDLRRGCVSAHRCHAAMPLNDPEPIPRAESRLHAGGALLAGTIACAAAVRLGVSLAPQGQGISTLEGATGLAIWLVVRFGPRMLFAVGLGHTLGIFSSDLPASAAPVVNASLVLAQVSTAYLGALMFRMGVRFGRANLEAFDEPVGCLAAALVAPLVSATVGVCMPILVTGSSVGEIGAGNWFGWWIGKAAGVLVVLPLLEVGPELWRRGRGASVRGVGQALLLVGLLGGVAWMTFGPAQADGFIFGMFPIMLLTAARFGAAGVRLMAFLVAAAATLAVSSGRGILPLDGFARDPLGARWFILVVAFVALVLPAIHHRRSLLRSLPLGLMLTGWTMGAIAFQWVQIYQRREMASELSLQANNAMELIERRLATYTDGLYSGGSFLLHAPSISRAEWIAFADTLNLPERYPGINGMGVIYPVATEDRGKFLKQVRADQAPDFALHAVPGGAANTGPEHYVVTHVAPLAGNRPALGLDLGTEAARRRAVEAARDTGQAQITARITLVQDSGGSPGFLLLVPVYRLGAPVATVAQRRTALRAWIYAPFVTPRFLQGVLGKRREKLELHFFDGDRADASRSLYASGPSKVFPARFDHVTSLDLGGQRFTLGWNRGPDFVPASRSPLTVLALASPVGVVLLVAWLVGLQTYRERAEEMVRKRTAELQASENRYRRMERGTTDGMWEWNVLTGSEYCSPRWLEMLGYPQDDSPKDFGSVSALIHPDDLARFMQVSNRSLESGLPFRVEMRLRRKTGDYLWVVSRGLVERDAAGKPLRMTGTITDISERRRSEDALRDSEQRFRTMIEWSPDAVIVHRQGRIIYVNPAAVALLGAASADDLAGKQVLEVTHPDYRPVITERLANATGVTGAMPLVEMGFLRRDGSMAEVEIQSIPIFYDGNPAVELVARDIGARKRVEAALRESEVRFEAVFEQAGTGVTVVDSSSGAFVRVNRRFCEMIGYSSDELLGMSIGAVTHPDDAEESRTWNRRVAIGEIREFSLEKRYRHKDGTIVWARVFVSAMATDGALPQFSIGVIEDISVRKRVEAALRESQELLNTIIDSSPSTIFAFDRQHRFTLANGAMARFHRMNKADILGRTPHDLFPPDIARKLVETNSRIIATGEAVSLEEVVTARTTGEPITMISTKFPLRDAHGNVIGLGGVATDISASRRAEQALRESEARLKLLIHASNVGLWDWNLITNEVYFSPEWKQQLGYANDELTDRFAEWETRVHPEDRAPLLAVISDYLEGRRSVFDPEFRLRHRDGSWRWILARADVTRDATGRPQRMMGCHIDVTGRKLAEAAAMDNKAKLQTIFETMSEGVALNEVVYDEDGEMIDYRILEINRAFLTTADYRGKKIIGGLASEIYGMSVADIREFWIAHRNRTEVRHTEFQSPIGHRWYHVATSPFVGNRFVTSFFDITARKTAELSVQASLHEKEALLKEVHHRVKNNLQVITSLLRLESGRSELSATREVLSAMVGRIRSMAQLHEALYRSKDFSAVDLGAYLGKLATQSFRTLGPASGAIQLRQELVSVRVSMDLALPCGLLVNELLSNSLQHGFPAGRSGEVRIELTLVDDGSRLRLRVSDTGVGLPADFAEKRGRSLGMQLVGDLARQLGSQLEIGEGPVAVFTVTFGVGLISG